MENKIQFAEVTKPERITTVTTHQIIQEKEEIKIEKQESTNAKDEKNVDIVSIRKIKK